MDRIQLDDENAWSVQLVDKSLKNTSFYWVNELCKILKKVLNNVGCVLLPAVPSKSQYWQWYLHYHDDGLAISHNDHPPNNFSRHYNINNCNSSNR